MGIILEPRLLFDGSVGNTAPHDHHHHDGLGADSAKATNDKTTTAPVDQSTAAQANAAASTTPTADAHKTWAGRASSDPSLSREGKDTSAQAGASGSTATSTPIDSVLFVDPRVANWQELADSVSSSTKVVVIDPTLDGISQVTQTLSTMHGIKEVDFLTYGSSGQIELGSSTVNDASLLANASAVSSWRNALTDGAQIQLWGCDVGAGDAGAAFVNDLHTLTGVGVAASTDYTGAVAMNGDWTLERTAGDVTERVPFSTAAIQGFDTVLDPPSPTVSLTNLSSDVMLGDQFTATVSFSNTGGTTGYAPYIELYVPGSGGTGQTEAATLTSATYLGSAASVQALTLTTDGSGHVGVVDPNVLNSSGVAQFVQAPTGYRAGDTMYVLTLPFGSFTVGQPAAAVNLTFQLDNRSDLGANALKIDAVGVFKYGDNATGIDASTRGTGTANTSSTPDIGVPTGDSSETANVDLIRVTSTVQTQYGEDETATGANFPASYVISVTPAPATDGDSINNLVVTYTLPNDVQWNGNAITFTGQSGTVDTTHLSTTTPGGSFTVTYSTLASTSTTNSAVASTITVPFYVPETDSSHAQILSDGTGTAGNSTTIALDPAFTYTATSWTPVSGSFAGTTAQPVSGSGNGTDPSFVAKSLAIQVGDSIGANGLLPDEAVTYTINFQVSDYFDIENLVINNILGDGMTLVPGTTPVLTLNNDGSTHTINFGAITSGTTDTPNGQTVALAGSNSFWSYSRNDTTAGVSNANVTGSLTPGATAMHFDLGALLLNAGLSTTLTGGTGSTGSGGTTGTITFSAMSLEAYTEANNAQSGANVQSIREGDSVSDSITQGSTGGGTVVSHVTGDTNTIYDSSSVGNTEAQGNLTLSIDQIASANGTVISTSDFDFQAGDLVTYTLDYTLTAGDYGALNLNAFLPEPVLNVPTTFTNDGTGLAAGTFKIISNPSAAVGNNPATATGNAAANSVAFNFGTFDTANDAAGQHVTVQFTVQASANPFVNGLLLTTQGQSKYTPYDSTPGTISTAAAIQQQHVLEPELVTKTGVVSDVNDSGSAQTTASYAGDTGAGNANPTTIFEPAGTASTTGVNGTFANTGVIPTTISDAENQNLTGADGGDTVRIVQTVQNTGSGNAFDVFVKGSLPTGFSTADVSNLTVTRGDGTTLTLNSAQAITDYFSANGVEVEKGGSLANAVLTGSTTASSAVMYVSYDLKLSATQAAGAVLTATGAIANWSASDGATGFVTGTNGVGVSSSNLTDNATITTTAASVTKTLTAGDDSTNVALPNVVVGETLTYTVVLTLPEGEMTGAQFNDSLPSFLDGTTASLVSVTHSTGVTFTGAGTLGVSGQNLTVAIGDVTNANHDATGTVTLTFKVQVKNSTNVDGSTISNSATVTSTNVSTLTSTPVVATEKDPHITETLTPSTGSSPVYSGETVTYTLTLTNAGDAPAQDIADTLPALPTGLTWVANSLTEVGGTTTGTTLNDGTRSFTISQLGAGASESFTFQATVANNLPASTSLAVGPDATTYTSMPGTVAGERSYNSAAAASTVTTGVFSTPVLSIVDQSNNTTATDGGTAPTQAASTTAADGTIGEVVRMKAYVQIPEGSNSNVNLAINLPAGLTFLNDGSATVALASPDGAMSSSTIDPTGTNANIQVNDTTGFNVATYNPTAAFDTSKISVSGNTATFQFGTVTDNANSATANYAVVEFNAVVTNVAGNQGGHGETGTSLVTNASVGSSTSNNTTVTVVEPTVTLAKTVKSIDESTGQVTWQVVVTNTGNTTAYNVNLNDAQPGSSNEGTISGLTATGTAANLVDNANGATALTATMDLAKGASETFTYKTTVISKTAPVPDATATATYTDLNENTTHTTSFDGSPYGATGLTGTGFGAGTTDGERIGSTGVNDYNASATIGLGTVSGNVWNDLGSPLNAADATEGTGDTELSGIALTGTWTGQTTASTVTTDAGGNYTFLTPDNTAITIASPTSSGSETLVYDTTNSTTFHHTEAGLSSGNASLTVTAASAAAITGVNYAYRLPDTAPTITGWGKDTAGNESTYTMGGTPLVLGTGGSAIVADSEIDTMVADGIGTYAGTTLTFQRTGTANSNDVFGGTGTSTSGLFVNGSTVDYNGVAVGTMTGGVLSVTFGTGATKADVQAVLNGITYSNSGSNSQLASGLAFSATLTDNNTQTGTTTGNTFQGTGGVKNVVAQVLIDLAPAPVAATFTDPNDTAASGAAVALTNPLSIPTNTSFSNVVLQVATGFQSSEDVLTVTGGTANTVGTVTTYSGITGGGNISAAYDSSTGAMTLTSASNTATSAQWAAAINAVKYYDSSDTPNTSARSVTIAATATSGETINGTLTNITVNKGNDSPILNTGINVSLTQATEDASAAPTGAVGTLVSNLIGLNTDATGIKNVTDPDGPSTVSTEDGIAITAINTAPTTGTWYYSTNNGTTWTAFTLTGTQALHLTANDRVYFAPTTANYNGTINNALTFHAWDGFDNAADGSITDIGSTFGTNAGANTAGTAYSIAADTLNLVVAAVNDAPIATGTITVPSEPEDTTAPTGSTVATIAASSFSDSADQQYNGTTNPNGSVANTLAGIAITANAATSTQGVWEYSVNGGTTWTAIPTTGLSDTSAIVLPQSAKIAFVPTANWNGTPGSLTVRLIDSSTDVSITGVGTGLALSTASTAYTGIDVSGHGGTTAISDATVPIGTVVTAVNDSPIVSGSATATTTVEDTPSSAGDTVSSLIGQGTVSYSDATDTVPGGSTGTAAAGIAIVGNASTATQGVWQYSTDGGAHWTNISTSVSDTAAVVIPTTATLRFDPAANWNGTPGSLTALISDGTGGLPTTGVHDLTAGAGTNAGIGGIGQWSVGSITIGETVTPYNDAPVASGTATLTTESEDTTSPTTNSVSSLFGSDFNDSTDTVAGGSTANTLAGIAITANAATTGQGVWKYSLDGGTTWVAISTSVSDASALVLPQVAKLEFVPAANFNGTPGALTTRLIDSSTDVSIPGVGTGASLSTMTTSTAVAYSGINVSGANDGGTTAISSATVPLGTFVSAVNDAPIASGSVELDTAGTSVSSLVTSSFSDTVDQQRGVNSTDGSNANTLAGIAITGDTANATTEGVWQYSVDNGATYHTISTSVSDTSALVLPNTALLQFVGVAGYTGTPGGLTARLVDTSTDVSITGVGTGASLSGGTTAYTGIDVSGVNDGGITAISAATIPINTIVSGTVAGAFQEPNDSSPIANEVPVNDTVNLSLTPSGSYTKATFQVTGNYVSGEDVLTFTNDAITMGNITASFDSTTGAITLTSSGNTATPTQWQAAIRAIQYYDSSDTPSTLSRTVTMTITESGTGDHSLGTSTITVAKANDSPILDTTISVSMPDQTEDNSALPSGAVGFLASTLVNRTSGPDNVTDPDGPSTTATTAGIAITSLNSTEGTWYYSTNGGTTWTAVTLTGSNALHLTADAQTRLYFQPTVTDWNGTIANAITFRAWDNFDNAGVGVSSIGGITGFGTGLNTAGSAYSSASESLPLVIDAVNDAPVASGSATLTAVTVGDPPASATVSSLFTPEFNDSKDQQFSSTNTTGSVANTLAGIAITGNAATTGEGVWKYSLDNGVTWTAIPTTGLSDTAALVLPKTAEIEFVGVAGYAGPAGALTTRLIDSSTDVSITGVGTGLALSTATTAYTGIDVSSHGGTTAISDATVPLTTAVNAVPVVTTTTVNPPIPADDYLTLESPYGHPEGPGAIFTGGLQADWLLGENVFRVMEVGIPGTANVSADVFYGTVPKQNLSYSATSLAGGALPPWLFFDPGTLRFTGTPPDGSEGTVDARVIARDFNGREAAADVHIVVVREQQEILGLLRTSSADRPAITTPAPRPANEQPPASLPGGRPIIIDGRPQPGLRTLPTDVAPSGERGTPQGSPPAGTPATPPAGGNGRPNGQQQGFGLSPQLREFSQAGRLARARGLLNALSAGPSAL